MRQLPAVHIGKEKPGAKQTTGGSAGKRTPPPQSAETGCTPASFAVTQLQTWKRADSSEERQDPLYEKHWKQTQIKGKHQAVYTAGALFPC